MDKTQQQKIQGTLSPHALIFEQIQICNLAANNCAWGNYTSAVNQLYRMMRPDIGKERLIKIDQIRRHYQVERQKIEKEQPTLITSAINRLLTAEAKLIFSQLMIVAKEAGIWTITKPAPSGMPKITGGFDNVG